MKASTLKVYQILLGSTFAVTISVLGALFFESQISSDENFDEEIASKTNKAFRWNPIAINDRGDVLLLNDSEAKK